MAEQTIEEAQAAADAALDNALVVNAKLATLKKMEADRAHAAEIAAEAERQKAAAIEAQKADEREAERLKQPATVGDIEKYAARVTALEKKVALYGLTG